MDKYSVKTNLPLIEGLRTKRNTIILLYLCLGIAGIQSVQLVNPRLDFRIKERGKEEV